MGGRPATAPASQRAKETASTRHKAAPVQRPPPPVPAGTPLVLHSEALKGVPKGVTAKTSLEDAHGYRVFCVYLGLTSPKYGKVMVEGGATKAVPVGAITQEAVASAEDVARCLQHVPYPAAAAEAARVAPKRVREAETPAVVDGPEGVGPLLVYRVGDYYLAGMMDTAGLSVDIHGHRDDPRGRQFVVFSAPPNAAGLVTMRCQDQAATIAWQGNADRFAVTDADEAQGLTDQFFPKLRPAAPALSRTSTPIATPTSQMLSAGPTSRPSVATPATTRPSAASAATPAGSSRGQPLAAPARVPNGALEAPQAQSPFVFGGQADAPWRPPHGIAGLQFLPVRSLTAAPTQGGAMQRQSPAGFGNVASAPFASPQAGNARASQPIGRAGTSPMLRGGAPLMGGVARASTLPGAFASPQAGGARGWQPIERAGTSPMLRGGAPMVGGAPRFSTPPGDVASPQAGGARALESSSSNGGAYAALTTPKPAGGAVSRTFSEATTVYRDADDDWADEEEMAATKRALDYACEEGDLEGLGLARAELEPIDEPHDGGSGARDAPRNEIDREAQPMQTDVGAPTTDASSAVEVASWACKRTRPKGQKPRVSAPAPQEQAFVAIAALLAAGDRCEVDRMKRALCERSNKTKLPDSEAITEAEKEFARCVRDRLRRLALQAAKAMREHEPGNARCVSTSHAAWGPGCACADRECAQPTRSFARACALGSEPSDRQCDHPQGARQGA